MGKGKFVVSQIGDTNEGDEDSKSIFRILVASDNHVGYKENDPIRGNDSFDAFEEVLKVAKEEKVDFLLLGGDLFHETNPSQNCLHRMIILLRSYVLGDGAIQFQMPDFEANFQDGNLNVELPIFIIHGNHDYPSDECGNLSVLDLMHSTKYLNHFGKFTNLDKIKKGETVIALYGIGYMKDKYFHKLLEDKNIEFVKPSELGYEKSVSILIIHQNRYKGVKSGQSYRNCVHPEQFPKWFNLIIRGHEHEQIDEVDKMRDCPIRVVQPGSTVATSIIPAEATPRRAILFEIKGQEANFQDIILIKSYRPILYENVEMRSVLRAAGYNLENNIPTEDESESLLLKHVQQSLRNFKNILAEQFPQCNWLLEKKPQLRFKVEHSGMESFGSSKLETNLSDIVANPGDIFKFWKRVIVNPNVAKNQTNPKLDENFINTLKKKDNFDTIGNDAAKDIKELYERRIQMNRNIFCLPTSLIMNTIDNVNMRNRNSQIEDVIKNLQQKLAINVVKNEEDEIKKINSCYHQQMKGIMQQISNKIDGNSTGSRSQPNDQRIIYRNVMNSQFDDLKSKVVGKIREKVAQLFVQDFQKDTEDLYGRENFAIQIEEDQKDSQLKRNVSAETKARMGKIFKEDTSNKNISENKLTQETKPIKKVKSIPHTIEGMDEEIQRYSLDDFSNMKGSEMKTKNPFQKKLTYAQLFKKQADSEEEEEEDQLEDMDQNDNQSDCEFGLDVKQNNYDYTFASDSKTFKTAPMLDRYPTMTQTQNTQQDQQKQNIDIKSRNLAPFVKRMPPPLSNPPQSSQFGNLMRKNINIVNANN